jgi:hypothetical protein
MPRSAGWAVPARPAPLRREFFNIGKLMDFAALIAVVSFGHLE